MVRSARLRRVLELDGFDNSLWGGAAAGAAHHVRPPDGAKSRGWGSRGAGRFQLYTPLYLDRSHHVSFRTGNSNRIANRANGEEICRCEGSIARVKVSPRVGCSVRHHTTAHPGPLHTSVGSMEHASLSLRLPKLTPPSPASATQADDLPSKQLQHHRPTLGVHPSRPPSSRTPLAA